MDTIEDDIGTTTREAGTAGYAGIERRRPGRPQQISPHLVALLRDAERQPAPPVIVDAQRAVVGLGLAVLLSVPLWLMLGVIAWALLG